MTRTSTSTVEEDINVYFPSMNEQPPKKKRRTNPVEKKYACTYEGCDKKYNRPCLLQEHERIHTGERPFFCDECGESFKRNSHLQAHKLSHVDNDSKPFKCEVCHKGFNCVQHLNRHVKTHYETFECQHCDAKFKKHTQLKKHVTATHVVKSPFKCNKCDKEFKQEKRMQAHVIKMHSDKPNYHCAEESCDKRFYFWSQLQEHIKEDHKKTPCVICGKKCSGPVGIAQHMKVHEQDKNKRRWICEVEGCGGEVDTRDLLVSHYRSSHDSKIPEYLLHPTEGVRPSRAESATPSQNDNNNNNNDNNTTTKKLIKQPTMIERLTGMGYEEGRSIKCPFEGCVYRFARQYDLRRHYRAKHDENHQPETGPEVDSEKDTASPSLSDAGFLVLSNKDLTAVTANGTKKTSGSSNIDPQLM